MSNMNLNYWEKTTFDLKPEYVSERFILIYSLNVPVKF